MILGLLCSKAVDAVLDALAPTISKNAENLYSIPIPPSLDENDFEWVGRAIKISHADWDSSEISLGFSRSPLLMERHGKIDHAVQNHIAEWQRQSETLREIEEFNNKVCLNAYGMEHEVDASVPIEKVVLFNNPSYRVQGENFAAFDRLILQDFLSYAVGCMFGRYSLDAPGLTLANQGERLEDYLARIPEPSFMPDADNVIPVLDGDWFPDDITERFRLFLRVTFGEAHFRENLRYIEDALGKDIRKYFTKDFYADHVKRYKKRPIYWMFSSPKGTFNALIYMHRYRPDTVSVLLNDYLREFISKLEGERGRLEKLSYDPSASQGQRTKALKDIAVIAKQIDELNEWERDVVFPLAQAKIEIDLDDGVKANYPKFGAALKKIPGLEAKDD